MFKSKEAMVWKYAIANQFKDEEKSCVGKLVKVYRTDRYVTAKCMACDYHVRKSEFKVERSAVVQPRIEQVKPVWKIGTF
jgi:hypothetical protein